MMKKRNIGRILVILIGMGFLPHFAQGQEIRLQDYESYFLHYGVGLSAHSSRYVVAYAERFTETELDTLHSVHGRPSFGFKVGFVLNARITDRWNLRILPSIGLYENRLEYRTTRGETLEQLNDYTLLELSILLKYKSVRYRNTRVYLVAGITPGIEARIQRNEEEEDNRMIETESFFHAWEIGVGLDIYMSFFKFSPELRYSFGASNVLSSSESEFHTPLSSLVPHHVAFYLYFEGGAY